jgi:hypothetical protein
MSRIIFLLLFVTILASSVRRVVVVGSPSLMAHDAEVASMISKGEGMVKDGDIIVRDYEDQLSHAIKRFNRIDPSYSHAGIVIMENGYPFVYHVLPNRKFYNGNICRDSLKRFCAPSEINGFGIFRYHLPPDAVAVMKQQLKAWQAQHIQFDPWFSYRSEDQLYCSEMVAKLILKATHGAIAFEFTTPTGLEKQLYLTRFPKAKEHPLEDSILAIDNLYMNPHCKTIARFIYTPY